MKKIQTILVIFLLSISCTKDKKGCWQAWDGLLVEVNGLLLCDKTKAEAKAAYGQYFFSLKGEPRYCWLLSNNVHYPCIPESVMQEFCDRQGLTFSRENCGTTCFYFSNHISAPLAALHSPTKKML